MAHHPGGREANEKKVKLRFFAIAEIEILDKLMVKESEKQALKRSEKSLAEQLGGSKEKIGGDCLEGSIDVKTVGSKEWSGKIDSVKKTGKQVSRKGLDYEAVCARNMGEEVTHNTYVERGRGG